jgi:hypothetical protein
MVLPQFLDMVSAANGAREGKLQGNAASRDGWAAFYVTTRK